MNDTPPPLPSDPAAEAAVRAALAEACPGREPTGVAELGRGNRKSTVLVTFGEPDPVVVQLSERQAALRSEATLLAAIDERTSVPVPRVLASGVADGVAYLVTARVDGEDLHERFVGLDAATRRALVRSFGRHLAALHEAFRFDGYGELRVEGGSLVAVGSDRWADWLAAHGRAAVERLPAAFDDLRADLRELFVDPGVPASPPARLYPWDFRPGNALVADGDLVAVVDWEAPLAASAALSVAKAEYLVADWYVAEPGPLRAAFAAGYERVRPFPTVSPVHRAAAVAASAVDSAGVVTNPGYPEYDREASVAFHRRALEALL